MTTEFTPTMSGRSTVDPNRPLAELVEEVCSGFKRVYEDEPARTAVAPGRVNLIGEHIDYCDGFVLPFAIERGIVAAFRERRGTGVVRVSTSHDSHPVLIDTMRRPEKGIPAWANYIRGVLAEFADLGHLPLPSFDLHLESSLPAGAGLSSSAALEVVTAVAVDHLLASGMDKRELALMAQRAEHSFAGVPCGIMDQFSSALSRSNHFLLIDCCEATVEHVPFAAEDLSILVADTRVAHSLAEGQYRLRRESTEKSLKTLKHDSWRTVDMDQVDRARNDLGEENYRRSRHVVTEIQRTIEARDCLKERRFSDLGALMYASHRSLAEDFEVSCDELDLMVGLLQEMGTPAGVIGGRMTGGGFGGSVVALCETEALDEIALKLSEGYRKKIGREGRFFVTGPAEGARLLGAGDLKWT